MKHKVKEIFDNREEYRRWQDDVQELFDCQITVDEIEMIQNYFKRAIEHCEHCINETDYPFKENRKKEIMKIKSMNRKLQKQKEMWLND